MSHPPARKCLTVTNICMFLYIIRYYEYPLCLHTLYVLKILFSPPLQFKTCFYSRAFIIFILYSYLNLQLAYSIGPFRYWPNSIFSPFRFLSVPRRGRGTQVALLAIYTLLVMNPLSWKSLFHCRTI